MDKREYVPKVNTVPQRTRVSSLSSLHLPLRGKVKPASWMWPTPCLD